MALINKKPLIVGIVSSLRDGNYTQHAVKLALQGAERNGATTKLIYLSEFDLPFVDGLRSQSKFQPEPEGQARFKKIIKEADGVVVGFPEYHNVVSGVLINALDLTTNEEWENKPVGLVAVSGAAAGGLHGFAILRTLFRALHSWVVPTEAGVPTAWKYFDAEGNLNDKDLEERLKTVGESVSKTSILLNDKNYAAFLASQN